MYFSTFWNMIVIIEDSDFVKKQYFAEIIHKKNKKSLSYKLDLCKCWSYKKPSFEGHCC